MKTSDVPIKTPCTLDFARMTPADGGRFCGDCKKVVRDLSAMREEDARAWVLGAAGADLCVRLLHDRHGNVFFGQRTTPTELIAPSFLHRAKRALRNAVVMAAPMAAMACTVPQAEGGGSAASHAHDEHPVDPDSELQPYMGGVSAPYAEPDAAPDAATDAATDADTDGGTTTDDGGKDDASTPLPPKT